MSGVMARGYIAIASVSPRVVPSQDIINPRRACAARVTVVVLCVCVCVCVCVCLLHFGHYE